MKFLIIGDLHGNKPKINYRNFDAIISPGDFCSDAPRRYMFQAIEEEMSNPGSETGWYDIAGRKKAGNMIKKSLADGRKMLKHLESFGVPVYFVPGNWDWTRDKDSDWNLLRQDNYKKLVKGFHNIVDSHNKIISLEDCQIIGYGISSGPEYPQYKEELDRRKPKELRRIKKKYKRELKKIASLFDKANKPVIFLSHNVPFRTPIDKITDKSSPRYGYHYGSVIARRTIERYQPLLCIGGHMHEHFGKCRIGKTVCINAGFGPYANILLELEKGRIKKLEFYKGR